MIPKRNKIFVIPAINNEEDGNNAFPKDFFIPRQWVNFFSLEEEGFPVKGLFDRIGWMGLLQKFSAWHYGP